MRNLKKVLALVLAMAMSLSLAVTAGAAFKDDDKIAAEYATAVEFAAQTGILEGFEDGTYGPQKNLTRAQLATMTYRIATGDVDDVYTADFAGGAAAAFTDTAATAWYAGYVGYAADAGYLKGVGDNLYKPNSAMTGYQALAAFLRVVGYNQPGQFTGADWTVQVAMIANEIGALEGIEGVDLNAAISREVAAQIIFNILFSDLVDYTPAFGYQNAWGEGSLATDVFDIKTVKDGEVKATAPWGQPATQWFYENGKKADTVAVSIAFAPVAEYTAAVSECDLADDLGLGAKSADVNKWFINGKEILGDKAPADRVINMAHWSTIGAQGTLTEIYEVDGDYWFVQIETWLGKIVDTDEAKVDSKGHEYKAATADLVVFGQRGCFDLWPAEVETEEFEKDDFVLVNYSFWAGEDGGHFLTKTAPVATGTQTKIDVDKEISTIGGTAYNWSEHYHYGFSGLLKTEYEVFVDFYGNVIGIQEPAPADPVYTIWESVVGVTNGYNPYNAGKIVNTTTGALEDIEVCSEHLYSDRYITHIHDIVKYVECEDGYEMEKAGTEYFFYSIVNGTPRIHVFEKGPKTLLTDNNTVFVVEMECGEDTATYEVYNGYKAVPTMSAWGSEIEVLDEDKDGIIDLVYVDAENALFAGDEVLAYILPSAKPVAGGVLADDTLYEAVANVVIGGEVVEVNVAPGHVGDLMAKKAVPVILKTDADGLVYEVKTAEGYNFSDVDKENSDEVVFLKKSGLEKDYVVGEDATVWVIDGDTAEVGTADDVDPGYNAWFKLASGSNVNIDTIILVKW